MIKGYKVYWNGGDNEDQCPATIHEDRHYDSVEEVRDVLIRSLSKVYGEDGWTWGDNARAVAVIPGDGLHLVAILPYFTPLTQERIDEYDNFKGEACSAGAGRHDCPRTHEKGAAIYSVAYQEVHNDGDVILVGLNDLARIYFNSDGSFYFKEVGNE